MRYIFLALLFSLETAYTQSLVTINIDIGGATSELPWNNLGNSSNGSLLDLLSSTGLNTGIDIAVVDAFNGTNTNGTPNADTDLNIPPTASGDSFFGNLSEFSGNTEPTGAVQLSGLDMDRTYDIRLFASRVATDNRQTAYTISGLLDTTMYLQVSNNTGEFVEVVNLRPAPGGTIRISATAGPENNNDFGFFYLGAIRLQYQDDIEPLDSILFLTSPTGGEYWQPEKSPEIRWKSQGLTQIKLEYTIDNGTTWTEIETTNARTQKYSWTVPHLPSVDCRIRVSSENLMDQSPLPFTISEEDSLDCHLVVLGSSTAAGVGPTALDSAWVWKLRDTLFQNDTRFRVTNLARGGFTTYNILPTGTPIPDGVSQDLDAERNITEALSLNPQGLIINLPSNDAANNYSAEDQLSNYDAILSEVGTRNIPHWICTTQPRNGLSQSQIDIQTEMRDQTLSRYGQVAIDFWNGLATNAGTVLDEFNSGDGVHLNNAGHQLLLDRVLGAGVSQLFLEEKIGPNSVAATAHLKLSVFPNPTDNVVRLPDWGTTYLLKIYSREGQLLLERAQNSREIQLPTAGFQYIEVRVDDKTYGAWVLRS